VRANAQPNPASGGWRVTLDVERHDARRPLELRLYLKRGNQTLTETWSYALPPEL
jgi:glucans biosynthesis protein